MVARVLPLVPLLPSDGTEPLIGGRSTGTTPVA